MARTAASLLAPLLLAAACLAPAEQVSALPERAWGELARGHMRALSLDIGSRVAGSPGEEEAARYIEDAFRDLGYVPELDRFELGGRRGGGRTSANVIAVSEGQSPRELIVGAHYDSEARGPGADDNASGIGVLLEVAALVREAETPYTIRFVAFGAEEAGLAGSRHFVSEMDAAARAVAVAMINVDSVTAGDVAYVYGSEGDAGRIRDWLLGEAREAGMNLRTQGGTPDDPPGTTCDCSDHAPFDAAGIEYAYFESTNWGLGDRDGYTQVATEFGEGGRIWHTPYDTLDYIEETFPGRIAARLDMFTRLLYHLLTVYEEFALTADLAPQAAGPPILDLVTTLGRTRRHQTEIRPAAQSASSSRFTSPRRLSSRWHLSRAASRVSLGLLPVTCCRRWISSSSALTARRTWGLVGPALGLEAGCGSVLSILYRSRPWGTRQSWIPLRAAFMCPELFLGF